MAYILCWGGIGRRVLLKLQSDPGCFRMKMVGGVVTHIFPGTFWLKMKKLTQGPVLKTKPNQQQKPKDQRFTQSDTLFPRTYRAGSNSQHCPRSKALQNPNKKIPVTKDYVSPGSAQGRKERFVFYSYFPEPGSQAGPKLEVLCLCFLRGWGDRCVPPCLTFLWFVSAVCTKI